MRNLTINTTAFEEENLEIVTDLTNAEIEKVLRPIIDAERNGEDEYDNNDLIDALYKAYPNRLQNLANEYLEL